MNSSRPHCLRVRDTKPHSGNSVNRAKNEPRRSVGVPANGAGRPALPRPHAVQPKRPAPPHALPAPAAPHASSTHPVPTTLQPKIVAATKGRGLTPQGHCPPRPQVATTAPRAQCAPNPSRPNHPQQPRAAAHTPACHAQRPQSQPRVAQPKIAQKVAQPNQSRSGAQAVRASVPRRAVVQKFASRVVQAVKFYPNLHPGAVERIEPCSLFRLENFTDQYRLRKAESHGVYVPNQLYNFVRTGDGATLLHNRYRHPSIAEGRQVLYAGEAFFNNGRLEWWSNGSGHYQPDADDAAQAALPLDNFYTYQQVIKGEHRRRPVGKG